ncbi:synaptotagmin 14 isoform X2 [Brevipalpus obovatus]|uniref:synaptotagmin 14 isoform X2 n=1 Tax=Brevipalpus obovatus TaxID=246614 RepID=UPI003D9F350A
MLLFVINVLAVIILLIILYTIKKFDLTPEMLCPTGVARIRCRGQEKCLTAGLRSKSLREDEDLTALEDDDEDNRSIIISELADSRCSSDVSLADDHHQPTSLFGDPIPATLMNGSCNGIGGHDSTTIKHRIRDVESTTTTTNHLHQLSAHSTPSPTLSTNLIPHDHHQHLHLHNHHHHNHHPINKTKYFDKYHNGYSSSTDHHHGKNNRIRRDQLSSYRNMTNGLDHNCKNNGHIAPREAIKSLTRQASIDLVSMAERGKMSKNGSMDGASYSSESASPDTEEEMMIPFLAKHTKHHHGHTTTPSSGNRKNQASTKLRPVHESPHKGAYGRNNGFNNRFHQRFLSRHHSDENPKSDNGGHSIVKKKLKLSSSLDKENNGIMNEYTHIDAFDSTRMLLDGHSNDSFTPDHGSDDMMIIPKANFTDDGPIGRYGAIQISHSYDATSKKLHVHIIKAIVVTTLKDRCVNGSNGPQSLYVKAVLMPQCKQKSKTKTQITINGVAEFKENFTFNRIPPTDIHCYGVRYRLFSHEKLKRDHCLGEYVIPFSNNKPSQDETKLWLNLEADSTMNKSDSKSDVSSLTRSDSTGSNHSMQKDCPPELLLGLSYNGTTGRLQVTVIRGSQLKSPSTNRASDTYVKLSLVSFSGQDMARAKTSTRRGQPNPHFKESFVFPVTLFQLPDVTLLISVYNKRSIKRRELIGWFSLGRSNTGEEERAHWTDMKENRGELISRWHVLLDS